MTYSNVHTDLGKEIRFNSVPEQVFASFPFPGAPEFAVMFSFFHEFGYYGEKKNGRGMRLYCYSCYDSNGGLDIWEGKNIAPLRSFDEWAKTFKL